MFDPLIRWSKENYGYLPWRKKRTLFRTLVSEIMLQQTTVPTVQNHFETFLRSFPTVKSLAYATEEAVLMAWRGLGYYRRAKNLKAACEKIEDLYRGKIPTEFEKLTNIPGIGDYTANAIITIGKNKRGLPIDVNIARVLSRLYTIKESDKKLLFKKLNDQFNQKTILANLTHYRETYEALMDLGRTLCQSKKTACSICPINSSCKAYKLNSSLSFPSFQKEKKKTYQLDLLRVLVRSGNKFLGERRHEGQWLSQQIEVPTFVIKSEDKNLKQYPSINLKKIDIENAFSFKSSITKYKITNYVLKMTKRELNRLSSKKYTYFLLNASKENISTTSIKSLKGALYL